MKIDKVVFYGHNTFNTYGYIHSSYFKAFKSLGYTCYWVNDVSELNMDFSNTLFFTEGQVDSNIPLRSDCYYVLHHCNLDKYINSNCKYIQLGNYLKFCEEDNNHYYPGDKLEKISNLFFTDIKNKLMYQPWATDAIPSEINETPILFNENITDIFYVGTIWDVNNVEINKFAKACYDNGKVLKSAMRVTDEQHKQLIQNSFIAPDIRGSWHKECGYLPCRIFKNISYGKFAATNSEHVYNVFEGLIPYSSDEYDLFRVSVEGYKSQSKESLASLIKLIKSNHTYLNRIENILNFFKMIY